MTDTDDQLILNVLYAQADLLLPDASYTLPTPIPHKLWHRALMGLKRKNDGGLYDTAEEQYNVVLHQSKADGDDMYYAIMTKKVKS